MENGQTNLNTMRLKSIGFDTFVSATRLNEALQALMRESKGSGMEPKFLKHSEKTHSKRSSSRRLKVLIWVGMLLFAGIYGFKYFWLEHPVGTGSAGPVVSRELFESVWSDRDVLLIGLGDSVTAGLGAQPTSKSYFNRLVKTTDDDADGIAGICLSRVLPKLTHKNFARSGSNSIENLAYLVPQVQVQSQETFGTTDRSGEVVGTRGWQGC